MTAPPGVLPWHLPWPPHRFVPRRILKYCLRANFPPLITLKQHVANFPNYSRALRHRPWWAWPGGSESPHREEPQPLRARRPAWRVGSSAGRREHPSRPAVPSDSSATTASPGTGWSSHTSGVPTIRASSVLPSPTLQRPGLGSPVGEKGLFLHSLLTLLKAVPIPRSRFVFMKSYFLKSACLFLPVSPPLASP